MTKELILYLNLLFREINFLELTKYFLNLQCFIIIFFKNREVEKLARLLSDEVEKLARHLAHWHVSLRNWHAFTPS